MIVPRRVLFVYLPRNYCFVGVWHRAVSKGWFVKLPWRKHRSEYADDYDYYEDTDPYQDMARYGDETSALSRRGRSDANSVMVIKTTISSRLLLDMTLPLDMKLSVMPMKTFCLIVTLFLMRREAARLVQLFWRGIPEFSDGLPLNACLLKTTNRFQVKVQAF